METNSVISLLPSTKQQVEDFARKQSEAILSGEVDPVEWAVKLKAIEKALELIKANTKELVVEEAQKYGKSFNQHGAKIVVCEQGTRYDFSGDPIWIRLNESLKAREAHLKALKNGLKEIDTETGEEFMAYPPVKKSTTGLTITLE